MVIGAASKASWAGWRRGFEPFRRILPATISSTLLLRDSCRHREEAAAMILRVIHSTTYSYGEVVSVCHTEARLAPRSERGQTLFDHQLIIEPVPGSSLARKDYFGNAVTTFTIDEPHQILRVTAQSLVETRDGEAIHPPLTPPWEHVREAVRRHDNDETFDAYQFVFESPRVAPVAEFAAYAKSSFPEEKPLLECALDLCHRI